MRGAAQRNALRSLLALLSRGIANDGDADELVSLYGRVFDGFGIALGQKCFFGDWSRVVDIDPEWMTTHTRLIDQDPSERIVSASAPGRPFIVSRDVVGSLRHCELFDAFTCRAKLADSMVQRFRTTVDGDVFMVVLHPKEVGTFDEDHEILARMLHPQMEAALKTRTALHALRVNSAPSPDGHAIVSLPRGSVTLDARAKRTWQEVLGPIEGHGWRRLERAIARTVADLHRDGRRSRTLMRSVVAELAWLAPEPDETRRAMLLFYLQRNDGELDPFAAELLSPMQRKVAEHAARGLKNPEIADALAITTETVRTHLREAMRRLGVRRVSELSALSTRGSS